MNDALNNAASYLQSAGKDGLLIASKVILAGLLFIIAVGIVVWLFSFIVSLLSKRKPKGKTKHEKVGIKKDFGRRS
jgi:uncharacterized membrane protein YhiD involved in acid resistance